jgi:arylsulfatase A-like enzyme
MITRRHFMKSAGLLTGGLLTAPHIISSCATKSRNPNIVYILADDLGYGDIRAMNPESKIPTPYCDRLARNGMIFTDAHSGSAVCTPTRYGILTGRYAWRTRLKSGVLWGYSKALIDQKRMTVASLLKQQGYSTACVGKWHLGWNWQTHDDSSFSDAWDVTGDQVDYSKPIQNGPTDLGFDYFFGIPASLDMLPYVYVENNRVLEAPTDTVEGTTGYEFYRGGPTAPGFKHEDVLPTCAEKAVGFIERHVKNEGDKPFFLYFPLTSPHTPILPTDAFKGKSGIGPYGDFVMQSDSVVGDIMKTLEQHGLLDNTLFIVTSDNGCSPMANFEDLKDKEHYPSYHFRGHKADIFEGGHRIPFIAHWPDRIRKGSACDDTICLTDLLATAASLVGAAVPEDAGEDSYDLSADLFETATGPIREATVHHSINGSFSIRQGKWKLELCPGSGGWSDPKPARAKELDLPPIQLYDLEKDIGEKNNVYDTYPEVVERLTKLLNKYQESGRSRPV